MTEINQGQIDTLIKEYEENKKRLNQNMIEIKTLRSLSVEDPESVLSNSRDELNEQIDIIIKSFESREQILKGVGLPSSLSSEESFSLGRFHQMYAKILFTKWMLNQLVPHDSPPKPREISIQTSTIPDAFTTVKSRNQSVYFLGSDIQVLFHSMYNFSKAHQFLAQIDRSFLSPSSNFLKTAQPMITLTDESYSTRKRLIRSTLKHWGYAHVCFARCLINLASPTPISSTLLNHLSFFENKSQSNLSTSQSELSLDTALKLAQIHIKEGGDLILYSLEMYFEENKKKKSNGEEPKKLTDIYLKLAHTLQWKGVLMASVELMGSQLDFTTASKFYLMTINEMSDQYEQILLDWSELMLILNPAYDFNQTIIPFLEIYLKNLENERQNGGDILTIDGVEHILSTKFTKQREIFHKVASPFISNLAKKDPNFNELLKPKTQSIDITQWLPKNEMKPILDSKIDQNELFSNIPIVMRSINYFQKHLEKKKGGNQGPGGGGGAGGGSGSGWKVIKSSSEKKTPSSPSPTPLNNPSSSSTHHNSHSLNSNSTPSLHSQTSVEDIDDLFTSSNPKKLVKDKKKIGQGAFSRVFSVQFKDKVVAMKVLNKDFRSYEETICSEVRAMKFIKHDNILSLIEAFLWKGKVTIMMDYLNLGALTDTPGKIKWGNENVRWVARETLKGLSWLHSAGFIHCDMKTDNILLSSEPSLKIGDLGLLRRGPRVESKIVGTLGYMAPELFTRSIRTSELDIYSLGCIVFELCHGANPFKDVHPIKIIFNTCTSTLPRLTKWDQDVQSFIERCIVHEPFERPSAQTLLEDPLMVRDIDVKEIQKVFTLFTSAVYGMYG